MKWELPTELTPVEKKVAGRLKRTGGFYVFLREYAHLLFDDAFQAELATAGYKTARGEKPLPPAMLAMVTLLQAYTGTSDAGAVEAAEMDTHWKCGVQKFWRGSSRNSGGDDGGHALSDRQGGQPPATPGLGHDVARDALVAPEVTVASGVSGIQDDCSTARVSGSW